MKKLQDWTEQGNKWNFEHKLLLCQAEEYFCAGENEKAKQSYLESITLARSHKFLNEEALAAYLASEFFFDVGDLSLSLQHFKLAHGLYVKYGAAAKATQLFDSIAEKFGNLLNVSS